MDIKKQISKITANPIGLLAGAGLGFMAAKKFSKTGNKYVLIGATVAGGLFGALAQAAYKAKKGTVTATTVKK
jgi:outer membrane lipoprotein SlyB